MLVGAILTLLVVLLALGLPVALALLVAGSVGLWNLGGMEMMVGVLKTTPLTSASNYGLISIPMFILMANFVIVSGVANEFFSAARAWVGRTPGGIAIAAVLTGASFGAVSGSSTAAAATLASTTVPAMERQGYNRSFAGGVLSITGTLSMLIPPSIVIVFYGILSEQSIGKLLLASFIPGFLVALTIIATILILVWRDPALAPAGRAYTLREKMGGLRVVWPFLCLFMAVTGVIYIGVATPSEAAGLGAFGAMMLALVRRKLTLITFFDAVSGSLRTTAMITLIVIGGHVFSYFLTITQVTQNFIGFVGDLGWPAAVVLFFVLATYLILGCFLDTIAMLILTVPIVLPLVLQLGYDPIWFGVITVIMAEVGLVTPPVGINAFVVARFSSIPVGAVFGGVWPHVLAHIVLVAVFCMFPEIILWLPSHMSD